MNETPQAASSKLAGLSETERIRAACIEAALHAHVQAGICGLCHEGRFEAAISAMRMLDLDRVVSGHDD